MTAAKLQFLGKVEKPKEATTAGGSGPRTTHGSRHQ